jgi:hypothetical protein
MTYGTTSTEHLDLDNKTCVAQHQTTSIEQLDLGNKTCTAQHPQYITKISRVQLYKAY